MHLKQDIDIRTFRHAPCDAFLGRCLNKNNSKV